jgi:hypothetical protein
MCYIFLYNIVVTSLMAHSDVCVCVCVYVYMVCGAVLYTNFVEKDEYNTITIQTSALLIILQINFCT